MKKNIFKVSCTILLALVLAACSALPSDNTLSYEEVSTALSDTKSISSDASITLMSDEENLVYKLNYTKSNDGEQITVLEPDAIAGSQIPLTDGNVTIEEKGNMPVSGVGLDSGITPLNTIPSIISILINDVPSDTSSDTSADYECTVFTYEFKKNDVPIIVRAWVDNQSVIPVKAQIFTDGVQTIDCSFISFNNA